MELVSNVYVVLTLGVLESVPLRDVDSTADFPECRLRTDDCVESPSWIHYVETHIVYILITIISKILNWKKEEK